MQELTPEEVRAIISDVELKPEDIQLPGQNIEQALKEQSNTSTQGIEQELCRDSIGNILLNRDERVETPCYILDYRNVMLSKLELRTIKGLLAVDENGEYTGNVAVYIWGRNDKGAEYFNKIGYGIEYELYSMLETVINALYKDLVKIYKDFGKGIKLAKITDISSALLNL